MKAYVFNFLVGLGIAIFGSFSFFPFLMASLLIPNALEEDTQTLFLGYIFVGSISTSLFLFFMKKSNYFDKWLI